MSFSPEVTLMVWQFLGLVYILGVGFALVCFYKHQQTIENKSLQRLFVLLWGFIILIIPLGWIMYLTNSEKNFFKT